jgi:hypothetical protein
MVATLLILDYRQGRSASRHSTRRGVGCRKRKKAPSLMAGGFCMSSVESHKLRYSDRS